MDLKLDRSLRSYYYVRRWCERCSASGPKCVCKNIHRQVFTPCNQWHHWTQPAARSGRRLSWMRLSKLIVT